MQGFARRSAGGAAPLPALRGCGRSGPKNFLGSHMDQFLQQLVNGLAIGGIYALVALGYTMVYGCSS